jgi:hypothetical protein
MNIHNQPYVQLQLKPAMITNLLKKETFKGYVHPTQNTHGVYFLLELDQPWGEWIAHSNVKVSLI